MRTRQHRVHLARLSLCCIQKTFALHRDISSQVITFLSFVIFMLCQQSADLRRFNRISTQFSSFSSIIRAMETGILRRTMSRIYTKKPVCVNRQNFQSISIDDALPALLIIPFGIGLSLGIFVVERIIKMIKRDLWCMKL